MKKKLTRKIILTTTILGLLSTINASEIKPPINEREFITGTWNLRGYHCQNPTNNSTEYWGWGTYSLTNKNGNITGSFQNENYPYKYEVEGKVMSNRIILATRRLDQIIGDNGHTNSWVYRGKISNDGKIIEVGPSKFPEMRKLIKR